jgi:glycosyltransferase involved in cell wall biosynthesis
MNVLFIHQNFPGQFKHVAPALVKNGHDVAALSLNEFEGNSFKGITIYNYDLNVRTQTQVHPWLSDFQTKVIRADGCFQKAMSLKKIGFQPDLIMAHPGWGESIFIKDVWPNAKLGIYCEFFYKPSGADVGFDDEFLEKEPEADACRLRIKNTANLHHFEISDFGIAPTKWQASTFPNSFRQKIHIIHDGIDTTIAKPDCTARVKIKKSDGEEIELSKCNEVLTFVNRNLEPYRGYHTFMRALPKILEDRPSLRVLIVGGDSVSYGKAPAENSSWRNIFAQEAQKNMCPQCWERVHFLGQVSYEQYLRILQVSSVHVYMTYPFVLSWSLLEAMAVGCAIIGSDTRPVSEVIFDNQTGMMVDFFDSALLAEKVSALLDDEFLRKTLGKNARDFCIENYDLKKVCLPMQLDLLQSYG